MRYTWLKQHLQALLPYLNPRRHHAFGKLRRKRIIGSDELNSLIAIKQGVAIIHYHNQRWHDDRGRYAYLLAKALDMAGYQLVFYPQFHFLSRLNKYKALLNTLNFRVIDRQVAQQLSGPPDSLELYQAGHRKRVKLEWIPTGPVPGGAMAMPYFMHPLMYETPYKRPNPRRSSLRRIFFGGNTTLRDYQRPVLASRYGVINRVAVLQHLKSQLHASEITEVTRSEHLTQTHANRLVIVRTESYSIAPSIWLEQLAQSDFFLACPGAHMPMCHNVIEAMRVGTIPLLQYPEYFHPPLKPNTHCLVYRDEDTLVGQVRAALRMPRSKIHELKTNVIGYYEQYLHPPTWIGRLGQEPHKESTLIINAYQIPA